MTLNVNKNPVIGDIQVDENLQPVASAAAETPTNVPTPGPEPAAVEPLQSIIPEAMQPDWQDRGGFQDQSLEDSFLTNVNEQERLGVSDNLTDNASFAHMDEDQLDLALLNGVGSAASGSDMEDILAQNEHWAKASGKVVAGFASKIVLNTAGGILAGAYGLGAMATSGIGEGRDFKFDKLWNNAAYDVYDHMSEGIEHNLGVKKSKEFQEAGFFEKMTNPVMWSEGILDAVAFTVGALTTEIATAGMGSSAVAANITAKIGKGLRAASMTRAAKLVEGINAVNKSTKFAKTAGIAGKAINATEEAGRINRWRNLGTVGRQTLVTGSAFEASVETRKMQQGLKTSLEAKGYSKEDIQSALDKAGYAVFAGNLVIVSQANAAMFGGLFKGTSSFIGQTTRKKVGKDYLKRQGASITGEGTSAFLKSSGKGTVSLANNTSFMQKVVGVRRALKNPITEGLEEAKQSILAGAAQDYYMTNVNGQDNFIDGISLATYNVLDRSQHQFTSKEGWNEILTGALVGGMGMVNTKAKETNQDKSVLQRLTWENSFVQQYKSAKTDLALANDIADTINGHSKNYIKDKLAGAVKANEAMQSYLKAVKAADGTADMAYDDFVYEYMKPYIEHGYTDIGLANLDVMAAKDPVSFAMDLIEPDKLDDFVNSMSSEELAAWQSNIMTTLYNKAESLQEAHDSIKALGYSDPSYINLMTKLLYKTKAIPMANEALTKAMQGRIKETFTDNVKEEHKDNAAIQTAIDLVEELLNGGKFVTKDGKTTRRTADDILAEFEVIAPDLLNIGAITTTALDLFEKNIKADVTAEDNFEPMQKGVIALLGSMNQDAIKATVEEIAMLNNNTNMLNKYIDGLNQTMASEASYKKLVRQEMADKAEDALDYEANRVHEMDDAELATLKSDVESVIKELSADPQYKDLVARLQAKLNSIENDYAVIKEQRELRKNEETRIAKSEAEVNNTEAGESTFGDTEGEPAVVRDSQDSLVNPSVKIIEKDGSNTEDFQSFIDGLAKAGVTPNKGNMASAISFFTGDFASTKNATNLNGKLAEFAAMSPEAFIQKFVEQDGDQLHMKVTTTITGADGKKLTKDEASFSSFMYSKIYYNKGDIMSNGRMAVGGEITPDGKEIKRAITELHLAIKKEVKDNGKSASFKNIKINYKHTTITKGYFKKAYDSNGNRVIKDNPVSEAITNSSTTEVAHIAQVMSMMLATNENGEIISDLTDVSKISSVFSNLMMNKDGKLIKGALFLRGVDQFGRQTVFKLNKRRLGDDSASNELSAASRLLEGFMTIPEADAEGRAKLIKDILDNELAGIPITDDTMAGLLGQLVHFGQRTVGTAGELNVHTRDKAIKIKGKLYKVNEQLTADASTGTKTVLVFDNVTDGNIAYMEDIKAELGTLRQQIKLKALSNNPEYASYILSNALTTDLDMKLPVKNIDKTGKAPRMVADFSSILERPKLFIGANEKQPDVEDPNAFDVSKHGVRGLFKEDNLGTDALDTYLDTTDPMGAMSFKSIFAANRQGNMAQYGISTSNLGTNRLVMNNVTMPDGIRFVITDYNDNTGMISYELYETKKLNDIIKAGGKQAETLIDSIDAFKKAIDANATAEGNIHMDKIKNLHQLTIVDKLNKKSGEGTIKISSTSIEKANHNSRKKYIARQQKYYTEEGKYTDKNGKEQDTNFNKLLKTILFGAKTTDEFNAISEKKLQKAVNKRSANFVNVLKDIIHTTIEEVYSPKLGALRHSPFALANTMNKFSNDKIETPWKKGKSLPEAGKDVQAQILARVGSYSFEGLTAKESVKIVKAITPKISTIAINVFSNDPEVAAAAKDKAKANDTGKLKNHKKKGKKTPGKKPSLVEKDDTGDNTKTKEADDGPGGDNIDPNANEGVLAEDIFGGALGGKKGKKKKKKKKVKEADVTSTQIRTAFESTISQIHNDMYWTDDIQAVEDAIKDSIDAIPDVVSFSTDYSANSKRNTLTFKLADGTTLSFKGINAKSIFPKESYGVNGVAKIKFLDNEACKI